jgi:hypothetical protein
MPLNLKESTYDWFVCQCGNSPASDGFDTCSPDGVSIEPIVNGAWDCHYKCMRCDAVYNGDTMDEVSK